MNSRERFLEVMNFNPDVRTLKWEFGFWGENINQWYGEGLPEKYGTNLPTRLTTVNASLYTTVWTHEWRKNRTYLEKYYGEREQHIPLPKGIAIWGGALYWPSQGFPLALDVMDYFGFDQSTAQVPVEQVFYPMFEPQVLAEDEALSGLRRRGRRHAALPEGRGASSPPRSTGRSRIGTSWQKIKEERLRLDDIRARFPANWAEWVQEYKDRDYPLAIGGYPCGFFGTLVHLLGYENVFLQYYDDPDLVKDILNHFTTLWIAIWEEILADVEVDCCHIWEDMSSTKGPMISKKIFNEFMAPCYRRVTDFLKGKGVKIILVDTDGNCEPVIPWLIDVGVTGCYPMEVSAGMDVVGAAQEVPPVPDDGRHPEVRHGPRAGAHRRVPGTGELAARQGRLRAVRRPLHLARRDLGAVQVLPRAAERVDRWEGEDLRQESATACGAPIGADKPANTASCREAAGHALRHSGSDRRACGRRSCPSGSPDNAPRCARSELNCVPISAVVYPSAISFDTSSSRWVSNSRDPSTGRLALASASVIVRACITAGWM